MVRINAILPEDTLVKIDAIAKEKKKSRSSFLREAAEKLIDDTASVETTDPVEIEEQAGEQPQEQPRAGGERE